MSNEGRPFKRIWGVAYKNLIRGDNPTREIVASRGNRDQLYNDPAIRLSEADIKRFETLVGKPICVEHDEDEVVGHIHHYEVTDDGTLRVMARIFTDTEAGVRASKKMENGELNGLSVGYTTGIVPGTTKVASKSFNELTLTQEPYFEGCYVSVQASKKPTYNTNSFWINLSKNNIMSEGAPPQETAAAPVAVVQPDVPQQEASSLLKVADGLKQQVDTAKADAQKEAQNSSELAKRNAALEAQIAELAAYKANEEARYAQEKKPEAEEVLALHEEMNGTPFPEETRQQMISTMCSKHPDALHNAKIMCSQAFAYKSQKELAAKAEAERAELMAKMKKMEEENALAMTRINASKSDLYGMRRSDKGKEEETEEVKVNASGMSGDPNFPYRGMHLTDVVIPDASRTELSLPYFRKTPASTISVTASKTATGGTTMTIAAAPRHKWVDELPNSQRNRLPHWFSAMTQMKDLMMAGGDVPTHHTLDRKDKDYF